MKITKTASGKQKLSISKSEWTNIGKKAGWKEEDEYHERRELMRDMAREDEGPTSPYSSTIELFDPSLVNETKEIGVNIEFDVDTSEYEGPHLMYPGGVTVTKVTTEEDVVLNGQLYPSGTDVSTLIPFFADEITWEKYISDLSEITLSDVSIPTQTYPRER